MIRSYRAKRQVIFISNCIFYSTLILFWLISNLFDLIYNSFSLLKKMGGKTNSSDDAMGGKTNSSDDANLQLQINNLPIKYREYKRKDAEELW